MNILFDQYDRIQGGVLETPSQIRAATELLSLRSTMYEASIASAVFEAVRKKVDKNGNLTPSQTEQLVIEPETVKALLQTCVHREGDDELDMLIVDARAAELFGIHTKESDTESIVA